MALRIQRGIGRHADKSTIGCRTWARDVRSGLPFVHRARRALLVIAVGLAAVAWAAVPPAATATPVTSTIQASGTHLVLNGAPYRFLGVNAYEAATSWGTNAGCGAMLTDAQLNQLFSSLAPNSLVRFWAFQGTMATNVHTGQLDWGPLDRVFAAAAAHGQRLIATVTDQAGTCDGGHWQDPSWYQTG